MAEPRDLSAGLPPIRPGLVLFLAWRDLIGSRIVTALMLAAIAAGVGFQVPIEANLSGYHAALLNEGVHRGYGAVRVTPKHEQTLVRVGSAVERLEAYPEVRAALPVLTFPGAVRARGRSMRCAVRGVDTHDESPFFRLTAGRTLSPGDGSGVVLGVELAEELGVGVGDDVGVRVILETDVAPVTDDAVARWTMTVRGLAAGTFGARDAVFLDRTFLASEAGRVDEAHSLAVYLRDPHHAAAVQQRIATDLTEATAKTWQEDSQYLNSNLRAIEAIAAVAAAMVVAAVAIPVLALLYINVLHRRRDIGLMSALGLGRAEAFLVFLLQAALLGVVGCAAGSGLGALLVAWFSAHPIFEWEGFVIRPAVSVLGFARPMLVVLGTTLAAGTLPAWLAARIDPAPVLRGTE